jgi:ubiquinone biosynthesis protein UbiJ
MTPTTPLAVALNHLLSRQPKLREALTAHAGKTAKIDTGFFPLCLRVATDGLLEAGSADHINVTIRVNPTDLPQILANKEKAFSYVSIDGDADLAKTIAHIAANLHWEAEEDLAPMVGDVAAVRIVQGARAALSAVQTTGKSLAENMAEYLLEENPVLLHRKVAETFAGDVAILRDDAERLTKRVALLEQKSGRLS